MMRGATTRAFARVAGAVAALLLIVASIAGAPAAGQDRPATQQAAQPAPAATPITVAAHRKAKNVAVITIHGEIDGDTMMRRSVMASSVERRIRTAVRGGADAIVFEIDSPGGEVGAALRIAGLIKECPVANTVAWIRPRALSGGAIVALAAREIVVGEQATFGDAMPVMITPTGPAAIDPALRPKIMAPIISSVVDSARRHNDAFGRYRRDEYLVQSIVASDMQLWWVRSKRTGVEMAIDRAEFEILFPGESAGGPARLAGTGGSGGVTGGLGVRPSAPTPEPAPRTDAPTMDAPVPAGSEQAGRAGAQAPAPSSPTAARPRLTAADAGEWELLDKVVDGTAPATFSALDMAHYNLAENVTRGVDGNTAIQPVRTDEDLRAFFGADNVRRLDRNWSEGLVLVLTNTWVRGILIVIFLIALFAEMSHPGASVPGAVAMLALAALLGPPLLIGMASWWEVAAIIVGLGLLGVEVFVIPGFGVSGVVGLLLLFGGLLGTFLPAGSGLFPSTAKGQGELLWAAGTIIGAFFTAAVGAYFVAKHAGSLPFFRGLVLREGAGEEAATVISPDAEAPIARVGEKGVTITPMHPAGRVDIGGRVIDAVSDFGFLEAGEPVRVSSVSGIRVGVERAREA